MKNIGIYVHIPFCKQKCKYCDFASFSGKENFIAQYFDCVLMEIEEKANDYKVEIINGIEEKIGVNTIYFGGGTPSFVEQIYIKKVLDKIKECFKVSKNAEITIEVNPGTVNKNKLQEYFDIGINRVSIGLQSTNDRLLKMLGRIHSYSEFEDTYNNARSAGFKNINVDLMIGLPTQTLHDVRDSLDKVIAKSPEHISVYSLIVEEGTPMFDLVQQGKLELPDEEIERKMYWLVKERLEEQGYNHYEISNFAKFKCESKHNANCWKQESYLGIGTSAHSYFSGDRFSNIENLREYIQNYKNGESVHNIIFHEHQDVESMMKEYMLLGLRKIEGVNITEFKNKFSQNPIYIYRNELDKLVKNDLIEIDENKIKLTNRGIDLANLVWMEWV